MCERYFINKKVEIAIDVDVNKCPEQIKIYLSSLHSRSFLVYTDPNQTKTIFDTIFTLHLVYVFTY